MNHCDETPHHWITGYRIDDRWYAFMRLDSGCVLMRVLIDGKYIYKHIVKL